MSTAIREQEKIELEVMIYRYSLAEVLRGLSKVCGGKAAHIQEHWQDEALAKKWDTLSRRLEALHKDAMARAL